MEMLNLFFNNTILCVIAMVILITIYSYHKAPLWLWSLSGLFFLWVIKISLPVMLIYIILMGILSISPLRLVFVSLPLVKIIRKMNLLPAISETERTALESGDIWIDKDLFSGKPNWNKIQKESYPELTTEENKFINGQVETICNMVNDWDVYQKRDLPKNVWNYLKKEKFFGMIIPKKYGGLEFSATAHSAVIQKLASRSYPIAIVTMVPNSLGPAELLIHYGTKKQKDYYLPRLADGREMPCFALTEPGAGSDAGSISSSGVLFKDNGKLMIRLHWNKRYITLAAVSTILGLAFKLKDPDNILGKGEDLGITAALIPSKTKGVVLVERHDPLGVPFYNCPTQGKDVIISIDQVIGGKKGLGKGWKMLMDCLAAGRGISLPATGTGSSKMLARSVSAYSAVRKQFGLAIGKFEGIEEPLARIGGLTYLMEAASKFTTGSIDRDIKPPIITAIAKYHFTELYRILINDAMDILGGAAISQGPRNLLANSYISAPISITVEGANIMTRTLIHFGQGSLRCHPYAYPVIKSLMNNDSKTFNQVFWSHIGFALSNLTRSKLFFLTRGWIAISVWSRKNGSYYRKLNWISATFAFMADYALVTQGANLKRRGKLNGRYGDILSWMYLLTGVLKKYENDKMPLADKAYFEWTMEYGFAQIQKSFIGIFENIHQKGPLAWLMKYFIKHFFAINSFGSGPSDLQGHKVCRQMMTAGKDRDRLTEGIFIPKDKKEALAFYDYTFELVSKSSEIEKKIRKAASKKQIDRKSKNLLAEAVDKNIISEKEAEQLYITQKTVEDMVQVDAYKLNNYLKGNKKSETPISTVSANGKTRVKNKISSSNNKSSIPKK